MTAVLIAVLSVSAAMFAIGVVALSRSRRGDAELRGYRRVELLGKGAMGEVWRASHPSLLRPAAIKLLRPELTAKLDQRAHEALIQRFEREVQITATLTSPHTVEVFDFGHAPDGTLYYVMELLHGLDAESLVKTYGPLPAERVVHLLRQVCASLAEAHHRKLIHRDIKPANIHVCALGMEVDFVKVLDFGLVRDLNTEHRLTVQGTTPGTPAYLAPEAMQDKLDHRSDLYALGCVAHFLLTGALVFEAESKLGMLAAHSTEVPLAPSKRTELPVPGELDAIVLALLAKNPAERPQSASELERRLAAVPLATPWTAERAESWWRAHVPELLARGRGGEVT